MSECPNCGTQPSVNRCPQGHTYCDLCSIVICVNPGEMLANDFNSFCPTCDNRVVTNAVQPVPQPPNAFFCPITHSIMKDPAIIQDGVSYEYEAIKKWLDKNYTSPLTNEDIDEEVIIKNTNLKNIINLWLEAHGKTHEDFD